MDFEYHIPAKISPVLKSRYLSWLQHSLHSCPRAVPTNVGERQRNSHPLGTLVKTCSVYWT
ncbi:hypothetical protein I79_026211 [Cricetulus griseus]|uniref:Uncharacterized protein n=1 Tax=Cricetulus griseus TaxID=10029 RepID=G3IQA7_CRIGR|nr:hypothetical protein I79_026211 [Cricetulus griseus]